MRLVLAVTAIAFALAAAAFAGDAIADPIRLEFDRLSTNSNPDLSGQLYVEVSDNGDGNVLFVVHNSGGSGTVSTICDVYWGPATAVGTYLSTTVDFVTNAENSALTSAGVSFSDGATPDHAPGGTWTAGATADSNPPAVPNGISLNEQGSFLIQRASGKTWAQIEAALLNGELRMAFHVQGIGTGGVSDSYESVTPVPEPATLGLLGLGLAGIALRRRKARA